MRIMKKLESVEDVVRNMSKRKHPIVHHLREQIKKMKRSG